MSLSCSNHRKTLTEVDALALRLALPRLYAQARRHEPSARIVSRTSHEDP